MRGAAQVQAPELEGAPAAAGAIDEDLALLSLLPSGKKKKKKKGGKAAAAPGEVEHDASGDAVTSKDGAAANGTGVAAVSRMCPGDILGADMLLVVLERPVWADCYYEPAVTPMHATGGGEAHGGDPASSSGGAVGAAVAEVSASGAAADAAEPAFGGALLWEPATPAPYPVLYRVACA